MNRPSGLATPSNFARFISPLRRRQRARSRCRHFVASGRNGGAASVVTWGASAVKGEPREPLCSSSVRSPRVAFRAFPSARLSRRQQPPRLESLDRAGAAGWCGGVWGSPSRAALRIACRDDSPPTIAATVAQRGARRPTLAVRTAPATLSNVLNPAFTGSAQERALGCAAQWVNEDWRLVRTPTSQRESRCVACPARRL